MPKVIIFCACKLQTLFERTLQSEFEAIWFSSWLRLLFCFYGVWTSNRIRWTSFPFSFFRRTFFPFHDCFLLVPQASNERTILAQPTITRVLPSSNLGLYLCKFQREIISYIMAYDKKHIFSGKLVFSSVILVLDSWIWTKCHLLAPKGSSDFAALLRTSQ